MPRSEDSMPAAKQKVRAPTGPSSKRPGPAKGVPKTKDAPKTLARPEKKRNNLTLQDKLTVLAYVKDHPHESQEAVVKHFVGLYKGALVFSQASLSRYVKHQAKLEAQALAIPNTLSTKRP
jgi:hypothetical protein